MPVRVLSARYESVPVSIEAPGTIQAHNRIVLSSQINGFVRTANVRAGDSVRAGQVLVTLDAREAESRKAAAQASIEEAEAALEEARKAEQSALSMLTAAKANHALASETFGRYQKLFEARSLSPQELDEMRSRRDAAAAEVAAKEAMAGAAQDRLRQIQARIAQANAHSGGADIVLGWTVVKAPSAGRIVERAIDPGSAIFPGSPLMVLESAANPQAIANIPAADLNHLRRGLEVRVHFSNMTPPASGRVSEIVPLSNSSTHTVEFKVDLAGGFPAPPGSFVRLEIPAGERKAMLLPREAVRETGQLTGVFTVDGSGQAHYRLVKATLFDTKRMEILAGLEPGERVVEKINADLTDGIAVEVQP